MWIFNWVLGGCQFLEQKADRNIARYNLKRDFSEPPFGCTGGLNGDLYLGFRWLPVLKQIGHRNIARYNLKRDFSEPPFGGRGAKWGSLIVFQVAASFKTNRR